MTGKRGGSMEDTISRKAAIEIASGFCHPGNIAKELAKLPSAQAVDKDINVPVKDCISRQAAIEALQEHRNLFCDNTPETFSKLSYAEKSRVDELDMAIATLINLPSAQPELCEDAVSRQRLLSDLKELIATWKKYPVMAEQIKGVEVAIGYVEVIPSVKPDSKELSSTHKALDTISRQAAIDALNKMKIYRPLDSDRYVISDCLNKIVNLPSAQPEQTNSWYINSWCNNCKEYDKEKHSCPRFNRVIKQTLDEIYAHAETEAESRFHAQQKWIPCSERC